MAASSRTVKVKFDGDAKGLAAAAKAGEREVDKFSKSTDKKFKGSGEKNAKSFADGFKRAGTKFFGNAAENLTGIFSRQFGTAVSSNPYIGAAVVGTLVAAAAIAGPAAGAIAASGLVAGVGGGLAAVGLLFAAKSEQVKAAWSATIDGIGARTRTLSKPFEQTLFAAADVAERTFARFDPALERSFAKMAPRATKFVDQMGRAFEELEPAVDPLTDAFDAVLDTLGPAFQSAMRDASRGLQDLARSVEESPEGLADLVRGAGQLTRESLDLVRSLNDTNQAFDDLLGASAVEIVMRSISASVFATKTAFEGLALPVRGLNAGLEKLGVGGDETARVAGRVSGALGDTAAAAGAAGVATDQATEAARKSKEEAQNQARAFEDLISKLFQVQNLSLGLSGAQINLEAAIDQATRSIKENGRTLNLNTEKGRANRSALNSLAQSANQQTEAMLRSGKGNIAAGAAAEKSRASFVRIATQMGLSKKQATALAASLIAIPPKKDTKVSVTGATGAKGSVDALANSIRLLPGFKNIQIKYTSTGVPTNVIGSEGRRASGGLMQPGRRYLTSERGAEIIEMGRNGGARVISGEQTPRELSQPAGGDTYVYVTIDGQQLQGRITKTVRDHDRNTTRRVQAGVRV